MKDQKLLNISIYGTLLFLVQFIWTTLSWLNLPLSSRFDIVGQLALEFIFSTLLATIGIHFFAAYKNRFFATFCIIIFVLGASNYLHLMAHGRNLNLYHAIYATDTKFVLNSVGLFPSVLMIVGILTFCLIFKVTIEKIRIFLINRPFVSSYITILIGSIFVGFFSRYHINEHYIVQNILNLEWRTDSETSGERIETSDSAMMPALKGSVNYSGEKKKNVLLLVLEGVSGLDLPSVSNYHGFSSNAELVNLDDFLSKGMVSPNFFAHQAQTNRGLYSILGGEYPVLKTETPKMSKIAAVGNPGKIFLSNFFNELGYRSLYIQGADLDFMDKRRFLKNIDFSLSMGADELYGTDKYDGWGLNDKQLFRKSVEVLETENSKGHNWFASILTVGTHHPYRVPKEFRRDVDSDHVRSLLFLDEALKEFFQTLDAKGILKNTLILVTSDESHGDSTIEDDFVRSLSYNLSFLGIVGEGIGAGIEKDVFGQIDVAPTIVDYLGQNQYAYGFKGRSLLRDYRENRDLLFSNTYSRRIFHSKNGSFVSMYDESYNFLESRSVSDESILKLGKEISESNDQTVFVKSIVQDSSRIREDDRIDDHFELWGDYFESIVNNGTPIFGSQFLTFPKENTVKIKIAGTVEETDSPVFFALKINQLDNKFKYSRTAELIGDQEFVFDYEFQIGSKDIVRVGVDLHVYTKNGNKLKVRYEDAVVSFQPIVKNDSIVTKERLRVVPSLEDLPNLDKNFIVRDFRDGTIRATVSKNYIIGPYKYLAPDTNVIGRTRLKLKSGSCRAFVDMSAFGDKTQMEISPKVTLKKGEVTDFYLTSKVSEAKRGFEYRLYLEPLEESQLELIQHEQFTVLPTIAHAGGEYKGKQLTNSKEAIIENLRKGFRFFEIDFSWTSDDKLVCVHDWEMSYRSLIGDDNHSGVPSYREFVERAEEAKYTPADFDFLVQFLKEHENVRVVTDVKGRNKEAIEYFEERFREVKDQVVVQIYNPVEYGFAVSSGFSNIIWTLYTYGGDADLVCAIEKDMNLFAITMPENRIDNGFYSSVKQQSNTPIYLHTLNDLNQVKALISEYEVSGVYSDRVLVESDLFGHEPIN